MRRTIGILFIHVFIVAVSAQIADTNYHIDNFYKVDIDSVKIKTVDERFYPEVNTKKSDAFYDSLQAKAKNNKWSSQLHDLLVVHKNIAVQNNLSNLGDRVGYFEHYSQKYIRKITIEQLDVFGPQITDTSRKATHWSQKLGNSLHISTSKSSIQKNIFISENDRIDPYLLADNERILRSKPNLQDARIYIVPIENSTDSVDVKIITKDVWPVALGIEIFDVAYGKVGLWNNNFLGLGHMFNFTGFYNLNKEPKFGYRANYRIPNIGHTLTTLDLRHDDYWNYKANKIQLIRNFVTPEIRFGGGLTYEKVNQTRSIVTIDTILTPVNIEFEYYDFWGGYSVPLKRVTDFRLRKSFFLTTRAQQFQFLNRPEVDTFYLYDFHNRKLYLLSTGWVWQGYQSTNLVYGFGDTEDIPYGFMTKLTLGHESGEFSERQYIGFTMAVSKYLYKIGYISHYLDIGTFYRNKIEQGTLNYKFQYFSPFFGNKRHIFRQFARIQYLQGYNRFNDEFVQIRYNEGIRGLDYDALKGDKRLFFNTELVYYSPHYFYGFRFVYFLFYDGGIINYEKEALFDNTIFSSIGVGFRFRNERLVFNTIQFRACYFPFSQKVPLGSKQNFDLTSTQKARLPEFANKIPGIIEY